MRIQLACCLFAGRMAALAACFFYSVLHWFLFELVADACVCREQEFAKAFSAFDSNGDGVWQ